MKKIVSTVLSKLDQLINVSTTNLSLIIVLVALLLVWKALGKI